LVRFFGKIQDHEYWEIVDIARLPCDRSNQVIRTTIGTINAFINIVGKMPDVIIVHILEEKIKIALGDDPRMNIPELHRIFVRFQGKK
jgi:hypothetical protein